MFRLFELCRILGLPLPEKDFEITHISTDSRSLLPGSLFVPLVGDRFDGHDYLAQAVKKGAVASLWSQKELPSSPIPLLSCEDTLYAYQSIAKAYVEKVHPFVIGITGSNGKTTTKDLIYSVLKDSFPTHCTKANFNNEIGVPRTILSMPKDTQFLVLEMGIEAYGEMEELTRMVSPDMGVFTNIGEVHLENYNSLDQIAQAKMQMVDRMKEDGILLVNGDDPSLVSVTKGKKISQRIFFFGEHGAFSCLQTHPLRIQYEGEVFDLPLFGKHQFYNTLPALWIGNYLGISLEAIASRLKNPILTGMRMDLKRGNGFLLIDDSYKSNPPGLLAMIHVVKDIPASRHVFLLGDMLGLGDKSLALHQKVGDALKGEWVIAYGDLAKDFITGDTQLFFPKGEEEALIDTLKSWLVKDSLLLVKGSRGLSMEKFVEKLFDKSLS